MTWNNQNRVNNLSSISDLRTSPCNLIHMRRTIGRSMNSTASATGGRTPLMMPRAGLGLSATHNLMQKTHLGMVHNQANQLALEHKVSTLLIRPTKATGMVQKIMRVMVRAHEMMVRIFRW
jgi:hypothetical protein